MRAFLLLLSLVVFFGSAPARAVVIDSFTQNVPFLTTGLNDDAGGYLLSRSAGVLGGVISAGLDSSESLQLVDGVGGTAAEVFWPSINDTIPDSDLTDGGVSTEVQVDVGGLIGTTWSATVTANDGANSFSVTNPLVANTTLAIPMSSFTGVDFTSIDSLRLLLSDTSAIGDTANIAEVRTGAVIPEPATAAMTLFGLLGLALGSRKSRR